MKITKRIIAFISAISLAALNLLPSAGSAATNKGIESKDPNGDGKLTLADAAVIHEYLAGKYNITDLTEYDVDNNDIVSIVDPTAIQLYLSGNLLTDKPAMTAAISAFNSMSAVQLSRQYLVYNAKNGAYKRNYSLSVTGFESENAAPNAVIGDTDDRISDWSNRGTAKIICNKSTSSYTIGTGFVVGKHTIATAAHVVFDTNNDQPYSLREILLFDEDTTTHSVTPKEYHIPVYFKNEPAYTSVNDYALITVEEDLSDYMSYNLGVITDNAVNDQMTVATVGFPIYIYSSSNSSVINTATKHDERMSLGSIIYANSDNLHYTADTSGGNSGGPIYATEMLNGRKYTTVIGINVAEPIENPEYNIGVRFNAFTLKFYNANPNIQY